MTILTILGGLCLIWFLPVALFIGMNWAMHLIEKLRAVCES